MTWSLEVIFGLSTAAVCTSNSGYVSALPFQEPMTNVTTIDFNPSPGSGIASYVAQANRTIPNSQLFWGYTSGGVFKKLEFNPVSDPRSLSLAGGFLFSEHLTGPEALVGIETAKELAGILLVPCQTFTYDTITGCDSVRSPSGKYLWTFSGSYRDSLHNYWGCDSIVTYEITILPSKHEKPRSDMRSYPSGKKTSINTSKECYYKFSKPTSYDKKGSKHERSEPVFFDSDSDEILIYFQDPPAEAILKNTTQRSNK